MQINAFEAIPATYFYKISKLPLFLFKKERNFTFRNNFLIRGSPNFGAFSEFSRPVSENI